MKLFYIEIIFFIIALGGPKLLGKLSHKFYDWKESRNDTVEKLRVVRRIILATIFTFTPIAIFFSWNIPIALSKGFISLTTIQLLLIVFAILLFGFGKIKLPEYS